MRLSAMGDAMAVPVLRAFVNQYPEVKITVISRPFSSLFLDSWCVFFLLSMKKTTTQRALGLFRLFEDVKKLEIDSLLIFIMYYVLK
jgi:ADP-heptose:LPS heptosyltransferase